MPSSVSSLSPLPRMRDNLHRDILTTSSRRLRTRLETFPISECDIASLLGEFCNSPVVFFVERKLSNATPRQRTERGGRLIDGRLIVSRDVFGKSKSLTAPAPTMPFTCNQTPSRHPLTTAEWRASEMQLGCRGEARLTCENPRSFKTRNQAPKPGRFSRPGSAYLPPY